MEKVSSVWGTFQAFWRAITEMVAKMPMMAMTTRSSMRVKANLLLEFISFIFINYKTNNIIAHHPPPI